MLFDDVKLLVSLIFTAVITLLIIKKKGVRWYIWVVMAAVVFIIAFTARSWDSVPKDEDGDGYIDISARQLWEEYHDHSEDATKNYTNKLVSVKGIVYRIGGNDKVPPMVVLTSGEDNAADGVICEFTTETISSLSAEYHKWDERTIKGECTGFTGSYVVLHVK
jgi:hypothetical protein